MKFIYVKNLGLGSFCDDGCLISSLFLGDGSEAKSRVCCIYVVEMVSAKKVEIGFESSSG